MRPRLTKFFYFRLSLAPFPPSIQATHVACWRCLTFGLFLWLMDGKKRAVWWKFRSYLCFEDLTLSVVCFLFRYNLSYFFSRILVGFIELRPDWTVIVRRMSAVEHYGRLGISGDRNSSAGEYLSTRGSEFCIKSGSLSRSFVTKWKRRLSPRIVISIIIRPS
jgi:hypothetical protein